MSSDTCIRHSFLKFVLKDASFGFLLALISHKLAPCCLSLERCSFLFVSFSPLFLIFSVFLVVCLLALFLLFIRYMRRVFLSFEAKITPRERKFMKYLVCMKLINFQFFRLMIEAIYDGVGESY